MNHFSVLLFVLASCVGAASSLVYLRMKGEIQVRLPRGVQLSPFGYPGKLFEIQRQHRDLYPASRLRLQLNVLIAAGAVLFLAAMILM